MFYCGLDNNTFKLFLIGWLATLLEGAGYLLFLKIKNKLSKNKYGVNKAVKLEGITTVFKCKDMVLVMQLRELT